MRLYLDSADRSALEPLLATGLFGGVTTNPLILQRAGVRLAEVPDLVGWLLERTRGEVFVQTTAPDEVDALVAEGRSLRALSDRLVVKIPATVAGLTATRRLSDEGVPVLTTAVYSAAQALLADAAGAAWIAPYLGRMHAAGRNGHEEILRIQRLLSGTSTRVLVASIKDSSQVVNLAASGVDAFTISTAVAHRLLAESLTEAAVGEFAAAAAALR
ncbi:transaldolase family protein [Cellulomonas endophytica]|uniref:transaldolase family protein n=1 Tax=Cellulomonas endophytica TaxID=2494735 RepID=UPI0010122BC6|nr:transaldolase family protein [Cellulomonas endophytica]